ncbi:MAG: HNH endonuclease family protein, partial [Actinobacteria bacterium]|nr:HNH endonuclease family protein [Actinomycetota bacterium]
ERAKASGMLRAGGGSAIGLLQNIRVENERGAGYVRALFKHWRDIDGDGCNAREQVLKRDSVTLPQVNPYKCKVIAGDWVSPYDGARWSDPADIDIDHVVALKEAWDSGAWAWSAATRNAYANDTSDKRSLLAVTDNVNQQKSDRDPSNWVPPLKSYLCTYLGNWISVKARWNLSMDKREWRRIKNLLNSSCAGLVIAPWSEAPLMGTMRTSPTATSPTATVPKTTATSPTATVPKTTATSPTATSPTATSPASVGVSVYPGAWCKPKGATGVYTNGKSYVCAKTNASGVAYSDGRARWRQG